MDYAALALVAGFAFHLQTFFSHARRSKDIEKIRYDEDYLNFVYYCFSCSIPILIYRRQIWRWLSVERYAYFAEDGGTDRYPYLFCACQIGVYLAMLITVWVEPRKKDTLTMSFHHVCTIFVVALSAMNGYSNSCMVILILHDLCDIPLHRMKLARREKNQLVESVSYCVTVLFFIVFRLILFPWVCFETLRTNFNSFAPAIISIICLLYVLHLYWVWMLLQQGYRHLTGKTTFDPREEEKVKE